MKIIERSRESCSNRTGVVLTTCSPFCCRVAVIRGSLRIIPIVLSLTISLLRATLFHFVPDQSRHFYSLDPAKKALYYGTKYTY
jgi:hypothetical protein